MEATKLMRISNDECGVGVDVNVVVDLARKRHLPLCEFLTNDAMPAVAFFYPQCLVESFCAMTLPSRNQAL